MSNITEQKNSVRKNLRAQLKLLSEQQKLDESALIRERIASYISEHIPTGEIIASFAGLATEPDLIGLHELLPHHRFAYPRCGADYSMSFHLVNDVATQLTSGAYGIREPEKTPQNEVSLESIAMFIVPAFGYTQSGKRLGKGGGYYDRALKSASNRVYFLGAIFSIQLQDQLPTDSHDIPVDIVVTGIQGSLE